MRKRIEEASNKISTTALPVEGTETSSNFVVAKEETSPSPCSWVRACGERGGAGGALRRGGGKLQVSVLLSSGRAQGGAQGEVRRRIGT